MINKLYELEYYEALKELRESDGKIERLKKTFQLTRETAKANEFYWHNIAKCLDRCVMYASDSVYEAICKAYIIASGRENKAFSILKDYGIKIYSGDSNYNNFFLKTIFPRIKENQEDIAAENVKDKEILQLARALGKMRAKNW